MLREKDRTLMAEGTMLVCEEVIVDGSGNQHVVFATKGPIRDGAGNVTGMFGIARDITDRKKGEEAVRASERHLRRVLDSLFVFVGVVTPDGTLVETNRAALEASGVEAGDVVGRPFDEAPPWSWSPQARQQLREAIARAAAGEASRCDVQIMLRDGVLHPVDFMLAPLRDDQGTITHLIPSAIDITARRQAEAALQQAHDELEYRVKLRTVELASAVTSLKMHISERKKAEQALRKNEEILRTLVNANPESILLIDTEGTILVINEKGAERLGTSVAGAIGNDIFSLLPPEVGPARRRHVEKAIAIGRPVRFEDTRQGEYYDNYVHPIIDGHGAVHQVAIVGIDLTDRKRTEEALKRETGQRLQALEQLRENERIMIQQNRQAAMGEMISNIAHQWRQPLNTLGMLIQRLQMFYDMGEFNAELLGTSTKEAMRLIKSMSATIDEFSNFFKPEEVKAVFSVNETIRRTISLVEANFRYQQISMTIHAEDEPQINGYPNEYSQALLNILLNARDAFGERNIEAARVTVQSFMKDGVAVVIVADNAGGIPTEILDKIFDPHFTTKGPKRSGIGLFMAKNIIERNMNGRLTARNTGQGAEFRIET
jgi:PAS domain S-box-containing protein